MELKNPIICTTAKTILTVTSSYSFSKLPEIEYYFRMWIDFLKKIKNYLSPDFVRDKRHADF